MNTTLFHRRRAQRFAQLLDEANGGRRHHVRTRLDEQLTELVAIGHQITTRPPTVEVDPKFRADTRAMLLATAQREGIGHAAEAAAEQAATPVASRWSVGAHRGTRRAGAAGTGYPGRLRTRGAMVVGIAAGAIAISGMSAASDGAVPGDPLYGVKRSTERAQLALASSDVTRGQLYLDFARNRLAEAVAVHADPDGYVNVLDDMDADTRHGVKLLHVAAMARRDPAALDAVEAFRTGQRHGLGDLLDLTTGVTRARTLKSLELLEAIGRREQALRGALSCGSTPVAGTDAIGPRPRGCTVSAPGRRPSPNAPAGQPTGREPAADQPSVAPAEADPSTAPTRVASTPSGEPTPAPGSIVPGVDPLDIVEDPVTDPTEDDGVLGQLGRTFGGLLG